VSFEIGSNLFNSRLFYESCGRDMIRDRFPSLESRIAVGVVGEGSDCFGYDDAISHDHDFGLGFCMWLMPDDQAQFGKKLSAAYMDLKNTVCSAYSISYPFSHICSQTNESFIRRRGVFGIDDFYGSILGLSLCNNSSLRPDSRGFLPFSDQTWLTLREEKLACAVNGEVFRDDLGVFSEIREALLKYYPDRVWTIRIASELYAFSQNGQSNYPRMMARGDILTARLCLMQAVRSAMSIAHLLNKKYAPFYKWMLRSLQTLDRMKDLLPLLERLMTTNPSLIAWTGRHYDSSKLNTDDPVVFLLEKIAICILNEMAAQNLVVPRSSFLLEYTQDLLAQN